MPQMGKLYLGDIDVTYMFMGEQCVYELVQETGGTASVTFSFLNSSLACPIAIMTTDGTLITTLTTAPYTYTATGGDRIKWSAATATGGNYYKAEGSLTIIGTKTQNIDMVPYYTVTFNWITPSTPGYSYASSSELEWYVSGATRYKSGSTINWHVQADGYESDNGWFSISGNTVIPVDLPPSGYDYKPLIFDVVSAGTITWYSMASPIGSPKTISFSTNKGTTWTDVTSGPGTQTQGVPLGTFSTGQEVWVKGINTTYEGCVFGGTAYFNLEGNLASLINGDSFSATTPSITTNRVFFNLFSESNVVSATNMIIPFGSVPASGYAGMFKNCTAMTLVPGCRTSELSNGCYESMFEGCTQIRTALPLPARTLAQDCYKNMFKGCTSLITVGNLSASTLQTGCYYGMFSGCTSLSATPLTSASTMANSACTYMFAGCSSLTSINMPKATTLSQDCYRGMFAECTSLTTPPTLSATTLGVRCYAEMFRGCSNLASVPALSVTTLAAGCYNSMFEDCTRITTAPALPATAMADSCYAYMFDGCDSLTGAPTLNATSLANYCYQGMFMFCRGLTTAPALPATTLAEECYSYMFYNCTALTSAPQLMAAALVDGCYEYMFYNCNKLTELWVYATSNASVTANTVDWVSGITTSGTLHVPQGMSSTWPTGISRRPINWTISEPPASYTETFYVYPSSQEWGNTPTFEVNGYGIYLYGDEMIGGKLYDVYKYTAPAGTVLNWSLYNVSLGQPQGGSLTLVGNNPTYITHKVQYAITSVTPSDAAIVLNNVATSSTIVDYSSAVTNVTWSVAKAGYTTQSGSTIVTANTNTAVTLTPIYNITFHISRQDTASYASNAAIYVDDVYIGVTNSVGELSYTGYSGQNLYFTVTKDGFSDYDGSTTITGNNQTIYATLIPTVTYSYSITTVQSGCTVEIAGNRLTGSSIAGGTYTYTSQTPGSVSYRVTKEYCDAETGTLTTNQSKTIALWGNYQVLVDPYVGIELEVDISDDDYDIFGNITMEQGGPDDDLWLVTIPYKPLRAATVRFKMAGYSTGSFVFDNTTPIGEGGDNFVSLTLLRDMYLTFEIISGGSIAWKASGTTIGSKPIQFRKNGGSWTLLDSTANTISVNAGDVLEFRGSASTYGASARTSSSYYSFSAATTNTRFKAKGNIMSMFGWDNFKNMTSFPSGSNSNCFRMFYNNGNKLLDVEDLLLPATGLTVVCYYQMFYGCTAIAVSPELPAPTLMARSYQGLFSGCTTLRYIKCLATNVSATNSKANWVSGVASSGTFVKASSITENTWSRGVSGIPSGWSVTNA